MAFPFVRQMGSESIPHKLHYDISMSKRTRKPAKIQDEVQNHLPNGDHDLLESSATEGSENNDHKSLKQLINGDDGGRGRNSLGQHFTEEEINNSLQLAVRKQRPAEGVKLKKMVGKLLRNLVKGGDQHGQLKTPRKKSHL